MSKPQPIVVLPTLSADGWVTDAAKMLDYLFSYYLLTDIDQTYVFKGELKSMPEAYYLYMNNPSEFANKVTKDFGYMLGQYFADSNIKCYAKQDKKNGSLYDVFLSAVVIDEKGIRHNLNRTISMNNGISTSVIKHSNYGDAYDIYLSI